MDPDSVELNICWACSKNDAPPLADPPTLPMGAPTLPDLSAPTIFVYPDKYGGGLTKTRPPDLNRYTSIMMKMGEGE